jgi:hypothetical protein
MPQTPGMRLDSSTMAMMQVEVPTTLTTSPSPMPAPMASQWASIPPTGMGMPSRKPSFPAHSRRQRPGDGVAGGVAARRASPASRQQRVDASKNSSDGNPPSVGVPHPLVAHGADAAGHLGDRTDAAEGGGGHVAVLGEGGRPRRRRGASAASRAFSKSPTRRNRRRRTSRWPLRSARGRMGVMAAASRWARWSHHIM